MSLAPRTSHVSHLAHKLNLNEHADVSKKKPQDGESLVYNASSEQYEPAVAGGGGGGTPTLAQVLAQGNTTGGNDITFTNDSSPTIGATTGLFPVGDLLFACQPHLAILDTNTATPVYDGVLADAAAPNRYIDPAVQVNQTRYFNGATTEGTFRWLSDFRVVVFGTNYTNTNPFIWQPAGGSLGINGTSAGCTVFGHIFNHSAQTITINFGMFTLLNSANPMTVAPGAYACCVLHEPPASSGLPLQIARIV